MGAWGYGIRRDDFVCDIIDEFDNVLKAGRSVADATKAVKSKFACQIKDTDDGPLFWIALADAQWTYGGLEPKVLRRVQKDFASGHGLDRWSHDRLALSRRRAAIGKFICKKSRSPILGQRNSLRS